MWCLCHCFLLRMYRVRSLDFSRWYVHHIGRNHKFLQDSQCAQLVERRRQVTELQPLIVIECILHVQLVTIVLICACSWGTCMQTHT